MDLTQGYIYQTVPLQEAKKSFFRRHGLKLAAVFSVISHLSILAWIYYQGVFAPFTNMSIVDDSYNEVKWIETAKLMRPLKYPPSLLPQPGRALPLNEMESEEAKPKPKKKKEKKADEEKPEEETPEETAENVQEPPVEEPKPPSQQPRFGRINARPIRDIVGKVYGVYKAGGLEISNTVFSLTLGFEVQEDGSLVNVKILKSSGSEQIDAAALNIGAAISESHALMPLAALSSTTATLELDAEKALLRIEGATPTTIAAEEMAITFSQQIAGLRLLMSFNNPEAAVLLSHLEIANEGNQLVAKLSMSRAEASNMMRKNFGSFVPAEASKLTDAR